MVSEMTEQTCNAIYTDNLNPLNANSLKIHQYDISSLQGFSSC